MFMAKTNKLLDSLDLCPLAWWCRRGTLGVSPPLNQSSRRHAHLPRSLVLLLSCEATALCHNFSGLPLFLPVEIILALNCVWGSVTERLKLPQLDWFHQPRVSSTMMTIDSDAICNILSWSTLQLLLYVSNIIWLYFLFLGSCKWAQYWNVIFVLEDWMFRFVSYRHFMSSRLRVCVEKLHALRSNCVILKCISHKMESKSKIK